MGYVEKRGDYWRARFKLPDGRHITVSDPNGAAIRFRGKREAQRAADEAEIKARRRGQRFSYGGRERFGDYASRWYAEQDLAVSTMQNYRRQIEEHLLPVFEDTAVADIGRADVAAWEKQEREAGYAEASIRSWRATLHLLLADAVDEGLRDDNPATRRRGRGRRTGRSRNRGPEKIVTTPLGLLLIAERAALLAARDDEFVAIVLMGYTGMRWGEVVGLETRYVRPGTLRVEWQLYELDNGQLYRCPPKDDSRRTVDLPDWLSTMLAHHIARTRPSPCACHNLTYVFRSHGGPRGANAKAGAKLIDVARRAGVSTGTVSTVLNRPESVAEATRVKVQLAIADLHYIRGGPVETTAPHWRRNGFSCWLFGPAVLGRYGIKAPQPVHPVPILADPWPGIPVRGRNAAGRADACWTPIAPGLSPHGLRHTHKTFMEELGTPAKLMDERMGHVDGSIQSRYSHVTPVMRRRLMDGLTGLWEAALDERRTFSPRSPVAVLDRLLAMRETEVRP